MNKAIILLTSCVVALAAHAGDDSCPLSNDGRCQEPIDCDPGTDFTDCGEWTGFKNCSVMDFAFQQDYANHVGAETWCDVYRHRLEVILRYQEPALELGCGSEGGWIRAIEEQEAQIEETC